MDYVQIMFKSAVISSGISLLAFKNFQSPTAAGEFCCKKLNTVLLTCW